MLVYKKDHVVSVDGSEIHYLRIGNPTKQKVFMFHGILGDHKMWLPYVLPLLWKYEFIIPDLRGHGQSDMFNHESSQCFDLLGEDLHRVRSAVLSPNERYRICAFSMGTIATLMMCEKYGLENCEKYVHIDHSLNFSIDNGCNNKIFQELFDEFSDIMDYADETLKSDVEKYRNYTYDDLTDDQKEMARKILKIIAYDTTMDGLRKRIPFFDVIANYRIVEPFLMAATDYKRKLPNYMIYGHCYTSNNRDFSPIIHNIPADCDVVFFVGMSNSLFDGESQIKAIRDQKADARVIEFEHSSHDLMAAEPLKFSTNLFKELF